MLRRMGHLTLTIEIHSDWSCCGADLSTWINGASMMSRRHSPFRLTAIRWSTRRASRQQNPRASANRPSRTHHRNSQRLKSLRDSPFHMDKQQFDDDSRTRNARALAIQSPTRCASLQQNPRFNGSTLSPSPLQFTIRVAPRPTYPHQ